MEPEDEVLNNTVSRPGSKSRYKALVKANVAYSVATLAQKLRFHNSIKAQSVSARHHKALTISGKESILQMDSALYQPTRVRGKSMYDENKKAATLKYLKTQKELRLWVKQEEYEEYAAFAESVGMSLRQFVKSAIAETMERMK